jgi:hypothetical protein
MLQRAQRVPSRGTGKGKCKRVAHFFCGKRFMFDVKHQCVSRDSTSPSQRQMSPQILRMASNLKRLDHQDLAQVTLRSSICKQIHPKSWPSEATRDRRPLI